MTVSELIDVLKQFPPDANVMVDYEAEPLLPIIEVGGPNEGALDRGAVVLFTDDGLA